jgi:hypothetical protein
MAVRFKPAAGKMSLYYRSEKFRRVKTRLFPELFKVYARSCPQTQHGGFAGMLCRADGLVCFVSELSFVYRFDVPVQIGDIFRSSAPVPPCRRRSET